MTKRKIPERAKDCVTIADKVAFSLMVRSKYDALNADPWSAPSDIDAIMDRYADPNCPWSHPEWAKSYADSEREKLKLKKLIYGKQPKQKPTGTVYSLPPESD